MSRSWYKLKSMSFFGSSQQPLLSNIPEITPEINSPTSPPSQLQEDVVKEREQSAVSSCSDRVPVLENKLETSMSPGVSLESSAQKDYLKKKKIVWADKFNLSGDETTDDTQNAGMSPSSTCLLLPQSDGEKRQSYILYEGKDGDGESFIHVQRDRLGSSFRSGNSTVSGGDITENQFSYKTDFIKVEVPFSNPDGSSMTTGQELQLCKQTVLKPYLAFLKLIGWRSFYTSRQDLSSAHWVKLLNIVYPAVLFSMMVFSCISQILTCFYRDQPVHGVEQFRDGILVVDCHADLITRLIIPDVLLLGAYVWGIYIFRFGAPEHLISLVETVFLSSQHVYKGQKKMMNYMRLIMVGWLFWLIVDILITLARLFSLQLLEAHTFLAFLIDSDPDTLTNLTVHTPKEDGLRWTFVIFDFVGFIFFDLLYIAVIISYMSQCLLLRLYIGTIIDRVLTKLQGYTLEQAMTDINQTYQFLRVVNGKLSVLTSICLIVFLESAVSSLYAVLQLNIQEEDNGRKVVLGVVVGVCNTILWSIMAIVPIIQAALLTSRCQQLRRLGLSVGHRPFAYHNTHQLLLDSFVQYTCNTRYRAKLAGIAVYPSYVFGSLFLLFLVGSFLVMTRPTLEVLAWF